MALVTAAGGCTDRGPSTTPVGVRSATPTPDPLLTVHPAARCYIDAINDRDLDALVACFAPGAVVVDNTRRIAGPDHIRRWAKDTIIGGRLTVRKDRPYAGGAAILLHWAPRGAGGWLVWCRFEFRDDQLVLVSCLNA